MESLGIPPETSNFDCLPGRAGGTPFVLAGWQDAFQTSSYRGFVTLQRPMAA
jgi:hypothetical protein